MKLKKLLSAILFLLFFTGSSLLAQTFLVPGFSQVKVASLPEATAMRFAPDGRIFVGQRDGTVNIIKNGVLLPTPFLKLTTDQNGERALNGICFDPNFSTNNYLYIYYTAANPVVHNRLSRFTANGDVAVAGSEMILLDGFPVTDIYHNGGGLAFGPDGKIYLTMGEDNDPNKAQDLTKLNGKMLRLNPDGSTPSDNPYAGATDPIKQKIWNWGLRNPYTLTVHPTSGRILINNVGSDYWEEIHDGTASGQNFGWPAVEGYGTNATYTNPIFAYPHQDTTGGQYGCAIVGSTFFNPATTNYPTNFLGKVFYMDFCNGWLSYFTPTANSYTGRTNFATGLTTQNLALQVGPDGNLYYLNRYNTKAGVWKIIYNNNNPPAISQQPISLTVAQSQPASFTVAATGGTPLSYQWKKDGVNIGGATSTTYSIASTAFTDAGQYTCVVSNSFGSVTSNAATLTITAHNDRPVATINTPSNGAPYHAGDVINFSGSATDIQDGTIPASKFEWSVEFWHNNNHYHPGPGIPMGITSGSFTIPNTGEASAITFYRLKLKVTDAGGLIDTVHIDMTPLKSALTFNTIPAGLKITYDGQPKTTPVTIDAVEGMNISIGVVSPQNLGGTGHAFDYWQQGGSRTHNIVVGSSDSSYTAVFADTLAIGINDLAENPYSLKVYPNPSDKHRIYVSLIGYEHKSKPVQIYIYDVRGKLIHANEVFCQYDCIETAVDLDEKYTSGTYLMDVRIEGRLYHQKFIIQ